MSENDAIVRIDDNASLIAQAIQQRIYFAARICGSTGNLLSKLFWQNAANVILC